MVAQFADDARIDVPAVHREVVVEQVGAGVLDAERRLVAGTGTHDQGRRFINNSTTPTKP